MEIGQLMNERGLTLVESMMGLLIAATLFSSLLLAALTVRSVTSMNRHYIQAVNVTRGALERTLGQGYGGAVNSTWVQAYDAGKDGVFGNADDLTGTVTVMV